MNNGTNAQTIWDATNATVSSAVSIRASNTIFSETGFAHLSDERIKHNVHNLDDNESLTILRTIEPKKYNYIDFWERGSQEVLGFIAQDVREKLPFATMTQTGFIPNVFSGFRCEGDKIFITDVNINPGTRIKLYSKGQEYLVKVVSKDSDYIQIDRALGKEETEDGQMFVYGCEVDDLISIKKDYLFTINFAATQELDRQVQQLRQENVELKEKLALIMAKLNL
jgi:hypothetical protein